MENILALGGRRTSPPQNDARQPKLVRFDRWTIVLGSFISLLVLFSQAQAAASITLAWDPSGASGITGYRLYYGPSSGDYTQVVDVGNATSAALPSLVNGQRYHFIVTGYDANKVETAPSNQLSFTVTPNGPFAISPEPGASDFNGSGQADLVWEDMVTGQRAIWFMNNLASLPIDLPTMSPDWNIVGAADFDGDGEADLVWENTATGQRGIWLMKNGVWYSTITLPTISPEWHIAGAADFDGGGYADLVWENTVTGQHAIWFLKNGVLSSTIYLPTVSTDWRIAGAADFNGDGYADLVWENTVTGQHAIWFMVNGVFQSSTYLPTISTDWHIAGAGDFNGDGYPDLIWENTVSGERAIWFLINGAVQSTTSLGIVPVEWKIANH